MEQLVEKRLVLQGPVLCELIDQVEIGRVDVRLGVVGGLGQDGLMADGRVADRGRIQRKGGPLVRRQGEVGEGIGEGVLVEAVGIDLRGLEHSVVIGVEIEPRPTRQIELSVAVDQRLGHPVPAQVLVQVRPLEHAAIFHGEILRRLGPRRDLGQDVLLVDAVEVTVGVLALDGGVDA